MARISQLGASPAPQWQPLVGWNDAQRKEASALVAAAVQRWMEDWVPAPGLSPIVNVVESPGESASGWKVLGHAGGSAAWLRGAARTDSFCTLIFGPAESGPLARAVAARAEESLRIALRAALHLEQPLETPRDAPPARRAWDGMIEMAVTLSPELTFELRIEGALVPRLVRVRPATTAPNREPLVPVFEAISERPIRLQVEITGRELDLGTLGQLQAGDIVPLPHPLTAPVSATLGGSVVLSGFLGRAEGALAIEVFRTDSPASTDESITRQAA